MYEEQTEKARNEYMTVHSKKVCKLYMMPIVEGAPVNIVVM